MVAPLDIHFHGKFEQIELRTANEFVRAFLAMEYSWTMWNNSVLCETVSLPSSKYDIHYMTFGLAVIVWCGRMHHEIVWFMFESKISTKLGARVVQLVNELNFEQFQRQCVPNWSPHEPNQSVVEATVVRCHWIESKRWDSVLRIALDISRHTTRTVHVIQSQEKKNFSLFVCCGHCSLWSQIDARNPLHSQFLQHRFIDSCDFDKFQRQ